MAWGWLRWLFGGDGSAESLPQEFVCSRCFQCYPLTTVRVLPWWNAGAENFITSYRCPGCFPVSLTESRERVRQFDEQACSTMCGFLRLHGLAELAREIAAAKEDEAQGMIEHVLQAIEEGVLVIPAG